MIPAVRRAQVVRKRPLRIEGDVHVAIDMRGTWPELEPVMAAMLDARK